MSDFISAKQFLSLDKKVQDSIIKWWEPQIGDLFENNIIMGAIGFVSVPKCAFKDSVVPLLSETQLRTYIENTIKGGVNINCSEDGYTLKVETDKGKFIACSEDLMECYLEIAVKVSA